VNGDRARIGPGTFVPVVGPSGAGKDTLIRLAAEAVTTDPRIRFPRRLITRTADTKSEDHDTLDKASFDRLVDADGVALHWRAHGLGYAVPLIADAWIAAGSVVVANLSRKVIGVAAQRYRNVAVVHVTAPPDILRARIEGRGRESGADIDERLTPVPVTVPDGVKLVEIVNDREPQKAAQRLRNVIEGLVAGRLDGEDIRQLAE
jgi:ribose 1,5-bisphosphokinase